MVRLSFLFHTNGFINRNLTKMKNQDENGSSTIETLWTVKSSLPGKCKKNFAIFGSNMLYIVLISSFEIP